VASHLFKLEETIGAKISRDNVRIPPMLIIMRILTTEGNVTNGELIRKKATSV